LKLIQSLGPSLRNNEKNCEYKIRDEIEGPWCLSCISFMVYLPLARRYAKKCILKQMYR
jgi:hypothetical protein